MTTFKTINLKKLRITPIFLVFSDEEGLSQNLAFGDILHKAVETCLHRIDEENLKVGNAEISFATNILAKEQIGDSKLLADIRNAAPRGYALSWEPAPVPKHFVLRISLFGVFAKVLPLMLARIDNIFVNQGYNKMKFVSVYDAAMRPLQLKRAKISPVPKVIKLHDFEIPGHDVMHIALSILSPIKLYNTQMCNFSMGFGDFVYHLLKRMVLMQYLYCDGPLTEPELFKQECIDLNLRVKTIKIDIALQNQKLTKGMTLEGYTGSIHYKTNLQIFNVLIPILKIGEYLQVGSSVNYGMGKYQIDYEKCL